MNKKLPTDPYRGVRDFYPEDMAVERYIFDTWEQVVETYGFERYDASILEPTELYSAKSGEEIMGQTYTFADRGDRSVTLRPEMTPTVARMVAGKRRDLIFPLRWYSIPNLFRYERPQRGRLREHWQLNCDIFGSDHFAADVELIALAYTILLSFGATPDMFKIKINNRAWLNRQYEEQGVTTHADAQKITALLDRKMKMSEEEFSTTLAEAAGPTFSLSQSEPEEIARIREALSELGVTNTAFDPYTVRGLDYYTGTIFEFFDTSDDNTRSLLGGGRYNNLTELFVGEPIPGVGFGMGDVTMRDFLETHGLLTSHITAPTLMIIPTDPNFNIESEKIAQTFRKAGISTAVDISGKKIGKMISSAGDAFVEYALVLGEDELAKKMYTVKNLADSSERSGSITELIKHIS